MGEEEVPGALGTGFGLSEVFFAHIRSLAFLRWWWWWHWLGCGCFWVPDDLDGHSLAEGLAL